MNIIPFAFSSLILFGCSSLDTSQIVGKYCFNQSSGDVILVNQDKTYIRKFTTIDGDTLKCKGKWVYNSLTSEMVFEDYLVFYNTGPAGFPPGNWLSRIK